MLVKWPRPPARICEGDQLTFRLEVESFIPEPRDPGGYAASVFLDTDSNFRRDLRCSDSDKRQVDCCGVYVMIPETSGWVVANTELRFPNRPMGLEFSVFHLSVVLDLTGSVHYVYRVVRAKQRTAPDIMTSPLVRSRQRIPVRARRQMLSIRTMPGRPMPGTGTAMVMASRTQTS